MLPQTAQSTGRGGEGRGYLLHTFPNLHPIDPLDVSVSPPLFVPPPLLAPTPGDVTPLTILD